MSGLALYVKSWVQKHTYLQRTHANMEIALSSLMIAAVDSATCLHH